MTKPRRNIILCGFMGTGKSSVGRRLAELAGYHFLDMDEKIEAEAGVSIPEIFASRGEAAFRALESSMVQRVAQLSGHVIATGGGTIANPDNLAKLKSCGFVVTLTADIPTILSRVGSGEGRPMLNDPNPVQRIQDLLQKRAAAYAQADISIDTSKLTIDEIAQAILKAATDFTD